MIVPRSQLTLTVPGLRLRKVQNLVCFCAPAPFSSALTAGLIVDADTELKSFYCEQLHELRGSMRRADVVRVSAERILLLSSLAAVRVARERLEERVFTTLLANEVKFRKAA